VDAGGGVAAVSALSPLVEHPVSNAISKSICGVKRGMYYIAVGFSQRYKVQTNSSALAEYWAKAQVNSNFQTVA
jgi:hypothetical protein